MQDWKFECMCFIFHTIAYCHCSGPHRPSAAGNSMFIISYSGLLPQVASREPTTAILLFCYTQICLWPQGHKWLHGLPNAVRTPKALWRLRMQVGLWNSTSSSISSARTWGHTKGLYNTNIQGKRPQSLSCGKWDEKVYILMLNSKLQLAGLAQRLKARGDGSKITKYCLPVPLSEVLPGPPVRGGKLSAGQPTRGALEC